MADATATKAGTGTQPLAAHSGANVVRTIYTAAASHSGTDVIQMVKVPRDAIIDEVVLSAPVGVGSQAAAVTLQVGDGGDPNRYISGSYSATSIHRAATGLGYQYTISDDAAVQFDTIDLTVDAGTLTAGHTVQLIVTYHLDNAE